MITEFTDRRPALSAALIVALFAVIPGVFMLLGEFALAGKINAPGLVFFYILVLQLILWLKVERPILIMLPFIMALIAFIVSEIVYTVSMSAAPIGQGPSYFAFLFSSVLVTLFGAEAAGNVGGLLLYAILLIGRKIRELITPR